MRNYAEITNWTKHSHWESSREAKQKKWKRLKSAAKLKKTFSVDSCDIIYDGFEL